jgi:hypothetical protein
MNKWGVAVRISVPAVTVDQGEAMLGQLPKFGGVVYDDAVSVLTLRFTVEAQSAPEAIAQAERLAGRALAAAFADSPRFDQVSLDYAA